MSIDDVWRRPPLGGTAEAARATDSPECLVPQSALGSLPGLLRGTGRARGFLNQAGEL
jgi:hypothetical protein